MGTIDKQQLIDTHYGAIAAKAVKQKPSTLTVQPKAQAQFEKTFGISWGNALSKGGFYCGKVDDIFVINGFYMDMRKAFTTPGTSIYFFETEWPSQALPWADFRGKVLGA